MTLEELLRQGKSFGQGASNAAASTVTGPVDMLAWLLRKGGVPVGDTPIGGEAWMRQKGLMATPENKLAGLLGEGAGLAAPIVAAAKAPEIAGGLLQMGRNLAAPQTMNKQTGAIVYHGSPHKFDKFDSSKIGTGEGAQAYGHGLYQAEAEDVAKQYLQGDGYLYKSDLPDEHIAKMLDWDKPLSQQHPDVQAALSSNGIAIPSNMDAILAAKEKADKLQVLLANNKRLASWYDDLSGPKPFRAMDSRISQAQSDYLEANRKGGELYGQIGGNGSASDLLQKAGIPGIRYLDGGSRSAGAGSSNFVIFPQNEGLLQILERNGKPIK